MFKLDEKNLSEHFLFIHFPVFLLQIPVAATVLIWTFTSGSSGYVSQCVKAGEDPAGDEEECQHH